MDSHGFMRRVVNNETAALDTANLNTRLMLVPCAGGGSGCDLNTSLAANFSTYRTEIDLPYW